MLDPSGDNPIVDDRVMPPMIGIAAPSGSGKTTLIEGLLRVFNERGLMIGVIKHDAHRLKLDTPGKDSWRYRQAGAWCSVVADDSQVGVFSSVDKAPTVYDLATEYLRNVDLVLVEGFRCANLPTIMVIRDRVVDAEWRPPDTVIAFATDKSLETTLPQLDLNDPDQVADFIAADLLSHERSQ